jgi:hypothetical protein
VFDHLKEEEHCDYDPNQQDRNYDDGYDYEQQVRLDALKKKKKGRRHRNQPRSSIEHDRWVDMYKVLFPEDHSTPSPCRLYQNPALIALTKTQTTSQTPLINERN